MTEATSRSIPPTIRPHSSRRSALSPRRAPPEPSSMKAASFWSTEGIRGGLAGIGAAALLSCATPASADLRLCNNTDSRVGIALGYRDASGWVTEGWWNVKARGCETLKSGDLVAKFYYLYAVDYDHGGEWNGKSFMCTSEREFTIRGVEDCLARGYDRSGFVEIDTGEQKSWTIQLAEPDRTPPAPAGPAAGSAAPAGGAPPAVPPKG